MLLTLLDDLFDDFSPVRQAPRTKPRAQESGLARAIGKLSQRLSKLEPGVVERNKVLTPLTVPIIPSSVPIITPTIVPTVEEVEKKEDPIGS